VTVREPRLITEPLGGSPLSRAVQDGAAHDEWYAPRPASADEWRLRADAVRGSMREPWWPKIRDAIAPTGAALQRLTRVVESGGIVVTTGQQPGLFGGPVYTWSKAVSALAFADELQDATGIACAPVFWAATDDSDFAEAAGTWVAVTGGAERLALPGGTAEGTRLADVPLGDMAPLLEALNRACGSTSDPRALDAVQRAYCRPGATVGSAYVALLRDVLEPLGIPVLDAAHPAVSRAAHPVLVRALEERTRIVDALTTRHAELRARGHAPQVSDVDGRTLVFELVERRRDRVGHDRAAAVAMAAAAGQLSPNVLLRPLVEQALLPSVGYVAGPAELAYFAQVSAVANALGMPVPLALARWSVTIVEPHIEQLLTRYDLAPWDFSDPHAVEARFARGAWPPSVASKFAHVRDTLGAATGELRVAIEQAGGLVPPAVLDGAERAMGWRLTRLERRISAAVKRREHELMRDLGTMRGSLYPGGNRQERGLNLVPVLSRHGLTLLDRMRDAARRYAQGALRGVMTAPAGG
jgi:bacillithiol biosynthesis cysteine-adding enzyme BshC